MSQNILIQYFVWHFFDASKGILAGWKNCLKFNLNYWSVPLLTKTLFLIGDAISIPTVGDLALQDTLKYLPLI